MLADGGGLRPPNPPAFLKKKKPYGWLLQAGKLHRNLQNARGAYNTASGQTDNNNCKWGGCAPQPTHAVCKKQRRRFSGFLVETPKV